MSWYTVAEATVGGATTEQAESTLNPMQPKVHESLQAVGLRPECLQP
jgi:hypothetical protein